MKIVNKFSFFLPIRIPTKTHQEKRIAIAKNGKPKVYEDAELKDIRSKYEAHLAKHAPQIPMNGPIELHVVWCFPLQGKHENGEPKTTKPDTDNMIKLFKDCMTKTGYWKDDAQVFREINEKFYSNVEGVFVQATEYEKAQAQ